MEPAEHAARIFVLTEDTSKKNDARATVEALVRKMLPLVVTNCRVHDRVAFLPTDPHEQEAMHGCVWKGDKPRDHDARVRLQRYIARRLREPRTFVVFHVDGDVPWEKRAASENKQKFEAFVVRIAQAAGAGHRNVQKSRRAPPQESNLPVEPDLDNLIVLMPFYTLESWLYQNLDGVLDICRRHHDGKHVESVRDWENKRHQLDEIVKPDEQFCVAKMHNLELASRGFPAQKVYEIKMSFFESVEHMKACTKLVDALLSTVETWA
ncbi:MAG TPA: hypothetical protein PK156_02570 [Polyangium sp.]|nr:hypothetical protein [Polyangium sp.]